MVALKTYMEDNNSINRWGILKVALIGGFCGATLAIIVMLGAVLL